MSSRFAEKCDNLPCRYHISMTPAHTLVAQACLGMLLHLDQNITRDSLPRFPLAEYAAEHWFEHARFEGVSQNAEEGMKQLFDWTKPYLSIWLWIHDPTKHSQQGREGAEGPIPPRGAPLHYAAFCGLDDIARILATDYPKDVNSQSFDGASTPLHLTSSRGHVDVARMLVERGADVSVQAEYGRTALHLALFGGHVDVARMLVERGADVSVQAEDGWTALHLALSGGHVDVARMLVERGADVSVQAKYGRTALHLASSGGHVDVARMLVERGADVSVQDEYGWTALHLASIGGHVDVARMLVERGADVSVQADDGRTALHLASIGGHVDVAQMLRLASSEGHLGHGTDGQPM